MYRGAMCAILSELVRQERVMVIADEQLELAAPKTKELLSRLASLTIDQALLVTHQLTTNLYLAARNLPNVWTSDLAGLDPVSLVQCPRLVISVSALKQLGERLA
jgi:large subunit ribosomal protein L4